MSQTNGDGDLVIDVQGVSKKFCRPLMRSLRYAATDILSEMFTGRRASEVLRPEEFWALHDVSFQLRNGEALALVGRNGAGKTTLLRIIAGLIRPDAGQVRTRGRVAPLIALGAGFSPVLTGRENIFANMAILGLSTREIKSKLDAVVDFAEIESAIDAPVRTYSSGMAARLGFACAIHTEPDVLLIDEVLAVGDIAFRAKCYRRLAEIRARKTAFILVSHNPHSVLSICESGVYLDKGRVLAKGAASTVMRHYEEGLLVSMAGAPSGKLSLQPKQNGTGLDILDVFLRGPDGHETATLETGKPGYLCVGCRSDRPLQQISFAATIREGMGANDLSLVLSAIHDGALFDVQAGASELRIFMPSVCLRPGFYTSKLSIAKDGLYVFDAVDPFTFEVRPGRALADSTYYQPREWQVVPGIVESDPVAAPSWSCVGHSVTPSASLPECA